MKIESYNFGNFNKRVRKTEDDDLEGRSGKEYKEFRYTG